MRSAESRLIPQAPADSAVSIVPYSAFRTPHSAFDGGRRER
jgi:hypothetical protein